MRLYILIKGLMMIGRKKFHKPLRDQTSEYLHYLNNLTFFNKRYIPELMVRSMKFQRVSPFNVGDVRFET
jgi:hypothetical protein